jgi:iron(III) transport system permease protein
MRAPQRWTPVLIAAVAVSALSLLPLAFVAGVTASTPLSTVIALVFRARVAELLLNTVLLVMLTVPLCIGVAVALAWLVERTDLPGRRTWSMLAVAPLAVPAFVQGYAWVSVFPAMHGLWAAVLLSVLTYFPFVFLPVMAALRRLDPDLEDVAAALGLQPAAVFRRVVMPHLRLAIAGGALLVGLHLLAEYGLYAMIRFDTFTTAIFDQFQSTYNGPAANMLAAVLALCCLVMLAGDTSARGDARVARVGAGRARAVRRFALGRGARVLSLVLPATVVLAAIVVPVTTLARWLVIGGTGAWRVAEIGAALGQTVALGLAGALLAVLAAFPAAWLSVRAPGRLTRVLESCNYVAGSLPGIVVALGLVTIAVRVLQPIYQTLFTVLLAYVLLFLPRALVSLRASIAQVPIELERVAASLRKSPLQVFGTVTLRLAAPGIAAAATLVFLGIVNELTATLLLAPSGTRTLATQFWALSSEIDYAGAAPYAVIMVALSLPIAGLLYRESLRVGRR